MYSHSHTNMHTISLAIITSYSYYFKKARLYSQVRTKPPTVPAFYYIFFAWRNRVISETVSAASPSSQTPAEVIYLLFSSCWCVKTGSGYVLLAAALFRILANREAVFISQYIDHMWENSFLHWTKADNLSFLHCHHHYHPYHHSPYIDIALYSLQCVFAYFFEEQHNNGFAWSKKNWSIFLTNS